MKTINIKISTSEHTHIIIISYHDVCTLRGRQRVAESLLRAQEYDDEITIDYVRDVLDVLETIYGTPQV
ncbi:MAG: hypothetical protein KatS3mg038_3331 [Candidatus Kapaibacterium sp.]|nr:MAG: hypothetical protein KatS3mg038_1987 [Candidatus Kapabacteria bacterium]GIV52810.1 MAG: hypothetical protein KatS3mg038_3331 [Candidatus Kapabacteria bacterium]